MATVPRARPSRGEWLFLQTLEGGGQRTLFLLNS